MRDAELQSEASECALACVAACLNELGSYISIAELRKDYGSSIRGATAKDIASILSSLSLVPRVVTCELHELEKLKNPAILHWGFNHFVVLLKYKHSNKSLKIFDPEFGYLTVKCSEASNKFTGIAIEISETSSFTKVERRSALNVFSLFKFDKGMRRSFAKVLLLSVLMQIYVILSPYYMQLAIDSAAREFDIELLQILAIGFGIFCLVNSTIELLRVVVLQSITAMLSWQMSLNLYSKLLKLPLSWFQQRKLADVLTRFDSLEPIKNLVANGAVSVVMDFALGVGVLIMMFIYSNLLATVAVSLIAVSIIIRLATIPITLRYSVRSLQHSIDEKGVRIDSIRGIQSLKLLGAEGRHEQLWASKFGQFVRAQQDTMMVGGAAKVFQSFIDNAGHIIVVYIAVSMIIDQKLSTGMLFAFMAYRSQLSTRLMSMTEQIVLWRMLDMHSNRLADIALADNEPGLNIRAPNYFNPSGSLLLRNVYFRYSISDPPVLKGINLEIQPGEFVAIVGRSGSGKSTLLKILTGLYHPTSGTVQIDGYGLSDIGPRDYRAQFGAVLQDDSLMTGTILENICSFADNINLEKAWECAKTAMIDDEIKSFPMKMNTFVGDVGSTLSGGQRQRILLARALYTNPKILVLDEATSNLDITNDKMIHDGLLKLQITRIVVTHRPQTAMLADRVFKISNGTLVEMPRNIKDVQT